MAELSQPSRKHFVPGAISFGCEKGIQSALAPIAGAPGSLVSSLQERNHINKVQVK